MSIQIDGLDLLQRIVDELGKVPQKVATKSARSGAQVDLTATKQKTPVYDGWLKASLKMVGEKSTKGQSKKVYEITFDRAYNQKLVKISKTGKRSYYPVSQEYGFVEHGKPVHGQQYMKNTAHEKKGEMEQKMVTVATVEVQKILDKAR